MVSFAALRAVTRRQFLQQRTPLLLRKTQKRGMALGGHHGPPPEWTGVDKVVRGYFPEDYQRTFLSKSLFQNSKFLFHNVANPLLSHF